MKATLIFALFKNKRCFKVKGEKTERILLAAEETDFKSDIELKWKTSDKRRPSHARRKNRP